MKERIMDKAYGPTGYISPKEVEELKSKKDEMLHKIKKQRDDLLDALIALTTASDHTAYGAALHNARAIIVKLSN